MRDARERLDLTALRERLMSLEGRRYWRSLEELSENPEFVEMLTREFPEQASEWTDPRSRRRFLQLMGASFALAGLTACGRPAAKIVPYVKQPEDLVQGKPLYFATALTLGGFATGVLVESHMGRPTKIEGNPDHPASLGATDTRAQAAVLTLYDPDRSTNVTHLGEIRPYGDFVAAVKESLGALKAGKGAGLRFLTGSVTSPTLAGQIEEILKTLPEAKWHQYEPAGSDNELAGAIAAFGEPARPQYRFDRADVVLSLDADFLGEGPGRVRYVKEFTTRRRAAAPDGPEVGHAGSASGATGKTEMNRLYVVEAAPTVTGSMADHRWPMRASEVETFTRKLLAVLAIEGLPRTATNSNVPFGIGILGNGAPPLEDWAKAALPVGFSSRVFDALVKDLQRNAGRSLVVAGPAQPPQVHALVHAINAGLENQGETVVYTDPVEARPVDQSASLGELASDMEAGRVRMLVVLGGNPAYDTPADLRFAELMEKVALRVHLGIYVDETAIRSQWHVPQAHDLESWSDARAFDGTVTIVQPLIEPLYSGRTAHEFLAAFTEKSSRKSREIVRETWSRRLGSGPGFEKAWNRALHDGLVAGTALPARNLTLVRDWWEKAATAGTRSSTGENRSSSQPRAAGLARSVGANDAAAAPASGGPTGAGATTATTGTSLANTAVAPGAGLEIVFRPDPSVYDGRLANNGWLQELPRPITKLTWDNAVLIGTRTAASLGVANNDLVELKIGGRTVKGPVWVLPGHADDAVTVHLGYGRVRTGRVGTGTGFDAYQVRPSASPWIARGAELRRTGARYPLAVTQEHQSMEGRELVRSAGLEEFRKDPHFAHKNIEAPGPETTMIPDWKYTGHAWGMAIDLSACIGCGACTIACQAENNIPVVGKEQVIKNREMHWIRVDRYFEGGPDNPKTWHQPVPCMHCEKAPCELVCPVAATVHSSEGLNDMVYNRCVGTRYCSNNCPYKVRRFNFLQFTDYETESLKLLQNPDVTVRTRGVMEKCTYCVQRINGARNTAETEGRPIRDGEITTACEQACPAGAIVFGDINDPRSRVSKVKADPRNYGLLEELNTRPRTTYLAAVRNPNPEIREIEG